MNSNASSHFDSDSDSGWREIPKIKAWEESLLDNGNSIESLNALNILRKRDGDPLFVLVGVKGKDSDGNPVMPYALLRGGACVVIPVCRNRDTGEKKFLMIRQRRIGHGGWSLEFPGGMLDENISDPLGTAVRELEEEAGLKVDASALTLLWDKPLFSSPGLSDESIYFYSTEIEMDQKQWAALEGSKTGHENEGEFITTTLKTFDEGMAELNSIQPLMGFLLYQRKFGFPALDQ